MGSIRTKSGDLLSNAGEGGNNCGHHLADVAKTGGILKHWLSVGTRVLEKLSQNDFCGSDRSAARWGDEAHHETVGNNVVNVAKPDMSRSLVEGWEEVVSSQLVLGLRGTTLASLPAIDDDHVGILEGRRRSISGSGTETDEAASIRSPEKIRAPVIRRRWFGPGGRYHTGVNGTRNANGGTPRPLPKGPDGRARRSLIYVSMTGRG
jgi:hypothetical protein